MTDWETYTGSDEQIAEMRECKNGFLLRSADRMYENEIIYADADLSCIDAFNVNHYLICNPHPLADMICQQARTGQPVWVRYKLEWDRRSDTIETDCTTTPDWNIPNAEYSFSSFEKDHSFTPFEEEV